MPDTLAPALKKSNTLLRSMVLRLFRAFAVVVVPRPKTALFGRFPPAGPMSLNEIVLSLFPSDVASVLNTIVPPAVPRAVVDDPRIVHRVTRLFEALLMKRMVLVFVP